MKTNFKNGVIYFGLVAVGFFISKWIRPVNEKQTVENHAHENAEFTCSMHPQVRLPEMGKCPICGMDLIPVVKTTESGSSEFIVLSHEAMKLAHVQTQIIGEGKSGSVVRLSGKVQPDERLIYTQAAHFSGRLESFLVKYVGERVEQHQTIGTMYSPDLLTAQQELQSAYMQRETRPEWYASIRTKLRNWKLSDAQIDRLLSSSEEMTIPIHSDHSGVVVRMNVNEGDHVDMGGALYQLADLSKVWILFDVYESQLDMVSVGKKVRFSVPSLGKEYVGEIEFIDPQIDPVSRVAKARISISNPKLNLKPEMLVSGQIESGESEKAKVMVPKSAIMWTGKRSIVYVKIPGSESGFALREVVLGSDFGETYEVIHGLEYGEEIAMNGTFTIDAAAQLEGKPSMLYR